MDIVIDTFVFFGKGLVVATAISVFIATVLISNKDENPDSKDENKRGEIK